MRTVQQWNVINRESLLDVMEGRRWKNSRDLGPSPQKGSYWELLYAWVFLDCWFFAMVLMSSLNTSYLPYNNFSFKSVIKNTENSVNRLVMNTHTHTHTHMHMHTHMHTPIPDRLWNKIHIPFHDLCGILKLVQPGPKWFFCMFFKI